MESAAAIPEKHSMQYNTTFLWPISIAAQKREHSIAIGIERKG